VIKFQHNRRPDIVVFVNGLPLAIIELKNAADVDATIWAAYSQLQTYKAEIPSLLKVASGGVIFPTIQKFMPEKGEKMPSLSDRRNIVVIADEAHRSQYDLIDGLARNLRDALPHASFIGFTGTPIEQTDANTRAIFGDYISIYDIQRAVADGATVPIYYESRIAKLALNIAALPRLDQEFDEITEGEEQTSREKLKSKWAALEALVGDPKRIKLIAADLIKMVRKSVTIDWTLRETARAKIRVIVKRILNKWGYPPDLQEEAVKTVLQQAELLCADWSDGAA